LLSPQVFAWREKRKIAKGKEKKARKGKEEKRKKEEKSRAKLVLFSIQLMPP
jgi:hypothetical protein